MSKLFHVELLKWHGEGYDNSHAVVTSVHVERMKEDTVYSSSGSGGAGDGSVSAGEKALMLDSVVSVTFSDVELYGALNRGIEEEGAPDIAAILSKTITSDDVMKALKAAELATDETQVVDLSFAQFEGTINERGIYSTDTSLISTRKNNGTPMFFAGFLMAWLLASIAAVATWIYFKENEIAFMGCLWKERSNRSVRYEGDVDVENATTASGVLGMKGGWHPQAAKDVENTHPNRMTRRPRKSSTSMGTKTNATDDESRMEFSPDSRHSEATAATKPRPLGITSMRKLNSFLTPQKARSERIAKYQMERLTYT